MIRIRDTQYSSTGALLTDAISIASYYGFVPFDDVPRPQVNSKKKMPTTEEVESALSFIRKDEKQLVSAARRLAVGRDQKPLFTWRLVPNNSSQSLALELHISGQPSSFAEAILIIVANAILDKAGAQKRTLSINDYGSPETSGRFVRDVSTFLRKHLESISPNLRPKATSDPVGTLMQLIEKGHPSISRAPQALEYLNEEERKRFWELLEYLEVFGLPYELSGHVLGSRDCWSHTLYEMSVLDEALGTKTVLASGGRYDPIVSRFARTPAYAAMISIQLEARGSQKPKKPKVQVPTLFLAHLGSEAKRRVLQVLEILRRTDIAAHQTLSVDRLTDQMQRAKSLNVPYILIIGHKEAVENAVVVREVASNYQENVPISELSSYLKRKKIGGPVVSV